MRMRLSNLGKMAAGMDPSKTSPKDAQVIASILKEMGVNEYEPRVINQLLDFSYSKFACYRAVSVFNLFRNLSSLLYCITS